MRFCAVPSSTIRPKIRKRLPEFLDEFPPLRTHPFPHGDSTEEIKWDHLETSLSVSRGAPHDERIEPGETAARRVLASFLENRLDLYPEAARDPNRESLSGLSPYLHFGHLSAQRVAIETQKAPGPSTAKEAFLEELIVRRELADNYCFYNPHYDSFEGFPDWAKKTLDAHRADQRDFIYPLKTFENAGTHDRLWNAAQMEMRSRGKMHSYMRMYWAKKILEWTESPEQAQKFCITLNDRYELDGRDPNGYTGIAWSLGGVHDRAWGERPIFGKVRYMSYKGSASKFDVSRYIDTHL